MRKAKSRIHHQHALCNPLCRCVGAKRNERRAFAKVSPRVGKARERRTWTAEVGRKLVLLEDHLVVVLLHVREVKNGLGDEETRTARVDLRKRARGQLDRKSVV